MRAAGGDRRAAAVYPGGMGWILGAALCALLSLPAGAAQASHTRPGELVLLARESVADPGLAAQLAELCGPSPIEIALSPSAGPPLLPREARRLLVPLREARALDGRELGRELASAGTLVLRGSSFMDWYDTLLPHGRATHLANALRRARFSGTHVLACGPAASFAAGATMIAKAELDRPRRNPRESGAHTAVVGLGLGPPAIVDAQGWPVGDALELLRALWKTQVDLGFFLEGEVALLHALAPHEASCLGPGRIVGIDLGDARRQRGAIRRGRLSILRAGDRWSFGHERVLPAAQRALVELAPGPERAESAERLALGELLESFVAQPARRLVLAIGDQRLTLYPDEGTRAWRDAPGPPSLAGLCFDLEWEGGATR